MTERADWESAAAAVLRKAGRLTEADDDAAVWSALTRTTYDGVAIAPLGTPLEHGRVRPERVGPWDIRAFSGDGPEDLVNREVLADLEGGATSVWLGVHPGTDFAALLSEVRPDLAAVVLRAADDPARTARAFLDHTRDVDLSPATNLGIPAAEADPELAGIARDSGILAFVVDANAVHGSGASDAQELGWAMAALAAYLRTLGSAGVSVEEAARLVELRVAVTDVQFVSIAKLRAARRLWARMLELSGADPVPLRLHAVTSAPMMSAFDPWVNLLRGTVAGFAAGVGGADAVTVLPFDSPLGRPDALGRRMARNVSSLLIAESHVAAVADPAGGAYAVEQLTDDLAEAAWSELGLVEEQGAEAFAARVRAVAERRREDVAHRRLPITGLSEYPQLSETLPRRPAWDEYAGTASYGADFEALRRDPVDVHVFVATLGPVAQHTARAGFAGDLLAAGGVAVDVGSPTAYAGQPVVCVAGSDAAYADGGSEAAAALRDAGARRVIVAGRPADWADWADDSCAAGDDAIAFLTRTRAALR